MWRLSLTSPVVIVPAWEVWRRIARGKIAGRHGDPTIFVQRLHRVLYDFEDGLLQLCLIELDGEQSALQLEIPGDVEFLAAPEHVHGALQEDVEIPSQLDLGILLMTAERGEVVGNLRGPRGRFFHFDEGISPRMIFLRFREKQGCMAENRSEGVVEIQRHGASKLERAIELLLLSR